MSSFKQTARKIKTRMVRGASIYTCHTCGKTEESFDHNVSNYGLDKDDNKHCYECCAKKEKEKEHMQQQGKSILYFTGNDVTDFSGTLKFKVLNVSKSYHNFAGVRYDYWFIFEGHIWHGYTIGDFTQIAHCKKTKQKV